MNIVITPEERIQVEAFQDIWLNGLPKIMTTGTTLSLLVPSGSELPNRLRRMLASQESISLETPTAQYLGGLRSLEIEVLDSLYQKPHRFVTATIEWRET